MEDSLLIEKISYMWSSSMFFNLLIPYISPENVLHEGT